MQAAVGSNHTEIQTYPLPQIYTQSALFSVKANEVDIPVVAYLTEKDYDYAHFSFSGIATITITISEPIHSFNISPRAMNIEGTVLGNSLTFQLRESRYLIIKLNELKEIVIAADPLETDIPSSSGQGIYNIMKDYHADHTGGKMSTAAIQQAIDDASKAGGGTVYVPDGVYLIGNLTLKSNITLYLQGGAVLRATGNQSDYAAHFHKDSFGFDGTWLIQTEANSTNITIKGRGTIDGCGSSMRAKDQFLSNLIMPIATSNFTIDGIIGRDAGLWALLPTRSSHVSITNYKGFQSLVDYEDDAIDIVECQHVLVKHTIAISEDDPYSTKTWAPTTDIARNWPGSPQINDDILIDDAVAWTHCAAFKLGMGVKTTQQNITFKNGYVYNCSRAIAIHHRYGTTAACNITFENIDIERVEYTRDGPYWLQLEIEDQGRGVGPVEQVYLKNVTVRDSGSRLSRIEGYNADNRISGVTFDHVEVIGKIANSIEDLNAKANAYTDGIVFQID
jgi:hypothetical protein